MTLRWGNTFLFHSSHQLPCLVLGPLKIFLVETAPSTLPCALILEQQKKSITPPSGVSCVMVEVPGHCQKQLTQT